MAHQDMLVKLYNIDNDWSFIQEQSKLGITIRKPIGPEKFKVTKWATDKFSEYWGAEVDKGFSNNPISCFIAIYKSKLIGFSCYDTTALGFFGPTGVSDEYRGKGTGKALLLAALLDMKLKGYGYAVIGAVGPIEFYEKAVGAEIINGSEKSIYEGLLRGE